jgi:predicted HTH transcriptional regulator
MNLKTEKFGKEIELAWLKGATAFMNSDGGTLLIGVGAEFSPLIRFQVQPIDSKIVVAVQCERSAKPVFLKGKNKEAFYIRSGPSSVELSPREVLEYVDQRA